MSNIASTLNCQATVANSRTFAIRQVFILYLLLFVVVTVFIVFYQNASLKNYSVTGNSFRELRLSEIHNADIFLLMNKIKEVRLTLNQLPYVEDDQVIDYTLHAINNLHHDIIQIYAVLIDELGQMPDTKSALQNARSSYIEFAETRDNEIVRFILEGNRQQANLLINNIQKSRYDYFNAELLNAQTAIIPHNEALLNNIVRQFTLNNYFLFAVATCVVLACIAAIVWVGRMLNQPITMLEKCMLAFTSGNTQVRFENSKGAAFSELQQIGSGFNEMAESINLQITKLEEEQTRNQTMLDSSPNAILLISTEGEIRQANPATETIFGIKTSDLIGKSIDALLPSDKQKNHKNLRDTYQNNPSVRKMGAGRDLQARHNDGHLIDVEIMLAPMKINGENFVMTEVQDISYRKQMENTNKEQNRLLRNKNYALDASVSKLNQSNEQLERFAYVCSHDLQEPLRMVESYSAVLEKRLAGKLDEKQQQYFGFLTDGARRAREMVADILSYSRLTHAQTNNESLDLNKLCQKVKKTLALFLEERNADFTWHCTAPDFLANNSQFFQLILNLVNNGIKYNRSEQPSVHMSASQQDDNIIIYFDDNGIGIESNYRHQVFNIFERLHSKQEFPGTGIGLASCKKIVEQRGGTITIVDKDTDGTRFEIIFPLVEQDLNIESSHWPELITRSGSSTEHNIASGK